MKRGGSEREGECSRLFGSQVEAEREISDRDAEQRWETEGGILIGPNARGSANICEPTQGDR